MPPARRSATLRATGKSFPPIPGGAGGMMEMLPAGQGRPVCRSIDSPGRHAAVAKTYI